MNVQPNPQIGKRYGKSRRGNWRDALFLAITGLETVSIEGLPDGRMGGVAGVSVGPWWRLLCLLWFTISPYWSFNFVSLLYIPCCQLQATPRMVTSLKSFGMAFLLLEWEINEFSLLYLGSFLLRLYPTRSNVFWYIQSHFIHRVHSDAK